MSIYAKVIADSISPAGDRVTTMEVRFHRFILAEFNTHRVFSRNSASSRAIPFERQMDKMMELGVAYPLSWPREKAGMSGGDEFPENDIERHLRPAWEAAAKMTTGFVRPLYKFGLHKSVINRLLEPFMWHTTIVTSTYWDNFFEQRCNPAAQPEIRALAELMQEAHANSEPTEVEADKWHMPYIDSEDILYADRVGMSTWFLCAVSAARCARVSYLTHDGKRDYAQDVALYEKLTKNKHWSPLEHVATPWAANRGRDYLTWDDGERFIDNSHTPAVGNLLGWRQLRLEVETEQGLVTMR